MNNKCNTPMRVWGRAPRQRLWQRCLELLQNVCVISAFVLFISYVQTAAAAERDVIQVHHVSAQR